MATSDTAAVPGKPKKTIVLCSDGTGNRGGKGNGTNVWRIYNYIDLNRYHEHPSDPRQISYYEDGVGTEDFKPVKLFGGAFGWGLSRNIQELYEFLIKNYEENDNIYLFGFSRGAFTVRSLAGLIGQCGIPKGEPDSAALKKKVRQAYRIYKRTHKRKRFALIRKYGPIDALFNRLPRLYLSDSYDSLRADYLEEAQKFKAANSHNAGIRFIGVWDTVSAVGMPFDFLRWILDLVFNINFHDHQIGPKVDNAYHALSIDDERQTFHPKLWDEHEIPANTNLEQVWFAGVHSNVGGGYPKQGMAYVTLYWMMNKARECSLHFKKDAIDQVRQAADVNDKIYNSRAGLAVYYRYAPRDIAALCEKNGIDRPNIHISVFDRIDCGVQNYAPGVIPAGFSIAVTEDRDVGREYDTAALERYGQTIASLYDKGERRLEEAAKWTRTRRTLYYSFVSLNLMLIYELSQFVEGNAGSATDIDEAGLISLLPGWIVGFWEVLVRFFVERPILASACTVAPLLILALQQQLKNRINRVLTGFWWEARGQYPPQQVHKPAQLVHKHKKDDAIDAADENGNPQPERPYL